MEGFNTALELLWKGMLAIFVAVGVIILFVWIMNIIDSKKARKENKTE